MPAEVQDLKALDTRELLLHQLIINKYGAENNINIDSEESQLSNDNKEIVIASINRLGMNEVILCDLPSKKYIEYAEFLEIIDPSVRFIPALKESRVKFINDAYLMAQSAMPSANDINFIKGDYCPSEDIFVKKNVLNINDYINPINKPDEQEKPNTDQVVDSILWYAGYYYNTDEYQNIMKNLSESQTEYLRERKLIKREIVPTAKKL